MRKYTWLLLLLFSFSFYGQNQKEIKIALLKEAEAMGKAFVAKDYLAFARFTHPELIKKFGSEKRMAEIIEYSFTEMGDVNFLDVNFAEPTEIITMNGELQCTVPQMIEMEFKGQKSTANTVMIAISRDGGRTWYFIDTAGQTLQSLQSFIPNLSPQLQIPELHEPAFNESLEKNK